MTNNEGNPKPKPPILKHPPRGICHSGFILHFIRGAVLSGMLFVVLLGSLVAHAEDTLYWDSKKQLVTADIRSSDLLRVLRGISSVTGWQVYVEPETIHDVSVKFKDLPPGEALHMLLGDVNFTLIPEKVTKSKLYVFRTRMNMATQLVAPNPGEFAKKRSKIIGNELIVRLKPGANIADIAKALGAKITGKIDALNAYRLAFDDAAAADAAKEQLGTNPDVSSVENNYSIDRPTTPRELSAASQVPPPPHLDVKPPPSTGRILVGLVDTALQPLGNGLDPFVQKQISVAGDPVIDPNEPSHGTSMAETMLRSLQSITKGSTSVQILPVDVYGPNESTSTFDVANGITTAVNKGANPINLSLGSDGDSAILHDVIKDASSKGIVFVAAAGNTPVTTPFYPAAYSTDGEVLAVTALDQGKLASYANRGSFVNLGAPGTSVVYFNDKSWYVMGTSASAAYVSGLVAGYADVNHQTPAAGKTFVNQNMAFTPKQGP